MPDAFDALRLPLRPADPDPGFAADLRARLARALELPRGVTMTVAATDLTRTVATEEATAAEPAARHAGAAVPYLGVHDARAALAWYVEVFGARLVGEPYEMPDGSIGHAELAFAHGVLYLAEGDYPEIGVAAADPAGTTASVSLLLRVSDLDRVLAAATGDRARLLRGPYEGYGARNATIFDPFGIRWMLTEPLPAAVAAPVRYRHGDTAYVSLWVPDVERAVAFYAAVLGWEFTGAGPGRQVVGSTPAHGLWEQPGRPRLFCAHAVDDLDAALDRVRDAGGEAGAPQAEPYGTVARCRDDQGEPFALVQLPPGAPGGNPPQHGRRAGDLAYLTIGVADAAAARRFYATVLGWEFAPGHVVDGWGVAAVAPMTGLWGGAAAPGGVPMYTVEDIAAAVRRVRAAGGTAGEPARQPYGMSAECTDDQGARFYLGEV